MNQVPTDEPLDVHEDVTDGDITRIRLGETEILLIGTAHISQESVDTVRRVIDEERPDVVAIELDEERLKSMQSQTNWQELDLLQVIKNKQLTFLMARLALSSFQKRMGGYTGVKPGAEMRAAIDAAEADDARVELIDRNIRTTLLRAWRTTPWWRRAELVAALSLGLFQKSEVDEEQLSDLREMTNISAILDELGKEMPDVKKVLVDERDTFMAYKLAHIEARKVVAVVGAAHKPGILRQIRQQISDDTMETISHVPPKHPASGLLKWLFPAVIVGLFIWGFFYADPTEFKSAAVAWFLAHGVLAALGSLLALAHPVTILTAFVAAPFTSLHPGIGAGMVAAFVQTLLAAPKVADFERIGDDIVEWKGWWSNRFGRILLVFFLTTFGSAAGTFISIGWLKNLV